MKATVRQVYALAAVLCEQAGEEFPETREAASALIERLRAESGHPAPRLEDVPSTASARAPARRSSTSGRRVGWRPSSPGR